MKDLKIKSATVYGSTRPSKSCHHKLSRGQTETLVIENNTENEAMGTREVTFGREVYIERGDFMEEPVKKFFRLAPGKEVRFKRCLHH